ncbi:MAG: Kup system potassium uptake protein [uncultured Gemmatimonadaceae bacterium]|uniref:Probable potassium transport system protein Kup n=1 Tax=uncultured Gemmatimonadaceae bacterium TaxID=246130 RepID=A0A6J4MH61_9BACT|nr:MAG: Kup system potassium uptake protein [uncultured Gemmatimonadaceae bacterium]
MLTLTALGVVYGDIGTSPLYALKECFKAEYGLAASAANVYGVLSLIVWSLVLIVTVKYVGFILRADNKGEGGVLALLALVLQRMHRSADARWRRALVVLGIFGGAFLYGDGIITPAISVLSAVEGIEIATPQLQRYVVPIAFVIIAVLFAVQKNGTAKVGGLFGWIMLAWFLSIAVLGTAGVIAHPEVLGSVNPWYAVRFFLDHPQRSFVVLGAVVLVVTGGEALYADMGHFGRRPIRLAWFGFVLPALLLNYFGQGALIIATPEAVENPFYLLAPRWFLVPLLVIATSAAIVASQALISGAFSLTQQAVQLGYTPRVTIVHTSIEHAGQIYIPEINKALAVGTLLLVVTFGSATALGAAYGVAVTGTMAITSILFYVVTRTHWGWSRAKAGTFLAFFLAIDLAFFASNLLKIPHGGWVPLAIAAGVFVLMTTWKRGRTLLQDSLNRSTLPLNLLLEDVERRKTTRVPGTAVFMTSGRDGVPVVLMHHLKHNKVLHEQVVLLSVQTAEVPDVDEEELLTVEGLGQGFYRVVATYGFMETPNVPEVLRFSVKHGLRTAPHDTSFYLGRERLLPIGGAPMAAWRKKLFVLMSRNARSATEFFGLPPNRVVELGAQIEF